MSQSSDHDILQVLDAAGRQWASPKAWVAIPEEEADSGELTLNGPAFVYRWSGDDAGPVRVSFWPHGEGRIHAGEGELLAIEPGLGRILLKTPDRDPMVIGGVESAIYQQIGELTTEAQSALQVPAGESWSRDLLLVAAAMRLTALTREAAEVAVGSNGKASKTTQRKEQIVTLLHEWLRPNLEKSVKLGDAAAQFNKSPRQLIRLLKETTGAGFAEHLSMHRLTYARALLMRTGQSVITIARAAGFNSREQFIRSFSKTFHWTPLQFRKAWSQAAFNDSELVGLCGVADRAPVEWLPAGVTASSPEEGKEGAPHTVVVANALQEIVELFWITPQGKRARIDVLERGGMVFVNRDNGGSCWLLRIPATGQELCFRTPDEHSLAVASAGLLGS